MTSLDEDREIAVSPESFARTGDGLEICYQTFGDAADEPLLLVMGLGGPMTWWSPELCRALADRGFFVIRYDNRDTGHSTKLRDARVGKTDVVKAFLGRPVQVPYSMSRLAEDGLDVLDALGIESAHIAGVSMGGMIVQTLAIEHPERVRSMVSIMSTTGSRRVGNQDPRLFPSLLRPARNDRATYVANSLKFGPRIASPAYPEPVDSQRARAEETFDRGWSASGVVRQMLAILTQPDRTAALREVTIPTAVLHGLSDRMVAISGGRATARALPTSELVLLPGMGHDLPPELHEEYVDLIRRTADRART